jgi:hypothetical protein
MDSFTGNTPIVIVGVILLISKLDSNKTHVRPVGTRIPRARPPSNTGTAPYGRIRPDRIHRNDLTEDAANVSRAAELLR